MALADLLRGALSALRVRATTAQVVDSSAAPWSGPYQQRFDLAAMVQRCFSLPGICAKFNAQGCADVRIRLYAPSKSSGIPRARKAWLRSTRSGRGPDVRAATYAEHAEEFDEVKEHPILDLLAKPNAMETGTEYRRKHHLFQELTGNAFHAIDTGKRSAEPVALNQLMPQYVRVEPAGKGTGEYVGAWKYGRTRASEQTFAPEEVMHCKMFPSASDPIWGVGPLHDAAQEADLLAFALQYETALMQNEGRPLLAAEFPANTSNDAAKAWVADFNKKHRGAAKAGGIWGTPGVKITNLGLTAKEMQYREGTVLLEKRILKAFGIPEALLGRDQGAIQIGTGGASAARSAWLSLTILHRVNAWTDTLNTYLLPMFGVKPGAMWLAADNPDADDEAEDARMAAALVPIGVQTLNEARQEFRYPAYPPEIGDVGRIGGVSIAAMETKALMPPPNPFGGPDVPPPPARKKARAVPGDGENDLDSLPFDDIQKKAEAWLAKSNAAIAAAVMPNGALNITVAPIATSFAEIVGPSLVQYYGKGWNGAAVAVNEIRPGVLPVFSIVNENAVKWAHENKIRLSESVAKTLIENGKQAALDTLNETIAGGISQGMSLPELQKAVADKLGIEASSKAFTIAATESGKAYGMGKLQGWKQSGIVKSRIWLPSSEPCTACLQATLEFGPGTMGAPIDQPFYRAGDVVGKVTASDDVYAPSQLHPNCRCDQGIGEYHE